MFEVCSKKHFSKYVGFIKPSECRMGGAQICLLRLLRLKEVLQEVVNSKQFLDLKLHKDVAYIIKPMPITVRIRPGTSVRHNKP